MSCSESKGPRSRSPDASNSLRPSFKVFDASDGADSGERIVGPVGSLQLSRCSQHPDPTGRVISHKKLGDVWDQALEAKEALEQKLEDEVGRGTGS